jgi:hypothetical protein
MTLTLALVLLFLGVFAVLLVSIHRHRCPYCKPGGTHGVFTRDMDDQPYVDPRLVEIAKRYAERGRS